MTQNTFLPDQPIPSQPRALSRRQTLLLPALLALAPPSAAAQADAVDLLLVLGIDALGSIDAGEFRLQREGCAGALVEWDAPGGAATMVDWHRVSGLVSAERLAGAVMDAPRSNQPWNAIGDAIDHAVGFIAAAAWQAVERVIDVSGDGPDMRGLRPVEVERRDAAAQGITVNALAIEDQRSGLATTYEATVIAGNGTFVMSAESRADFARALRAKLVREIA